MTAKSLLLVGALTLSSLTLAYAKTYEISLSGPTKVGTLNLKPGQYRLKVDGANATFTEVETSKQFTTAVKVNTADKKFEDTRVDADKNNGTDVVKDIELGGTKTKLEF